MNIVDAHFHLWDLRENYYPWLSDGDRPSVVGDYSSLRRNYLITDFRNDIATLPQDMKVTAAVHIQAEHDPRDHVRETRWLQAVADDAQSGGMPNAIVANADLTADDAQAVLEAHCAFRNVRGIRQALHRRLHESPPFDPLDSPAFQRNFQLLARYGLSFDLQFFPQQGEGVELLVRRHPDVQFILTHAGMPLSRQPQDMALWRRNMVRLAQYPHVATKISGFGLYHPEWDLQTIEPVIAHAVEVFSPARCMLASNFPVERIHRSYREVWQALRAWFATWSASEREALFSGNAMKYYRIAKPSA